MLANGIQTFIDIAGGLINYLAVLLPYSPFRELSFGLQDMQLLRWLAWVLPLDFIFTAIVSWLAAMAQFFALGVILRKLSVIK